MITPSQASAIAEILRDCERALDRDQPRSEEVERMLRDDCRDWARDLDGLVRDTPTPAVTFNGMPVRIADTGGYDGVLLALCPHCNDPLCDDRCAEVRP